MDTPSASLFDNVASEFVERQSIHDLCSKQIAECIKGKEWIKTSDSVMVGPLLRLHHQDFGCGVGSFSFILQKAVGFEHCLGVDSSEKMVTEFNQAVLPFPSGEE